MAGMDVKTAIVESRILIIDAHPVYAPRMEGYLRGLTFRHIRLAQNGAQGLALLPGFQPDLVILSGMLPDMDSADCCAKIREIRPAVKIIVQTGLFTEAAQEEQLRSCGADAVLPRREKDMGPLERSLEDLLKPPACPGSA